MIQILYYLIMKLMQKYTHTIIRTIIYMHQNGFSALNFIMKVRFKNLIYPFSFFFKTKLNCLVGNLKILLSFLKSKFVYSTLHDFGETEKKNSICTPQNNWDCASKTWKRKLSIWFDIFMKKNLFQINSLLTNKFHCQVINNYLIIIRNYLIINEKLFLLSNMYLKRKNGRFRDLKIPPNGGKAQLWR